MQLRSWTGLKVESSPIAFPRDRFAAVRALDAGAGGGAIYAGGRSYSDIALPVEGGRAFLTRDMQHMVRFDRETGLMRAEAGASLRSMQEIALAAGWGLPIIPGTAWATLGGALASDVHGKNHSSSGAFSRCVVSASMWRSDRGVFELTRSDEGLWKATVGGLGATGVILDLTIQLKRWPSQWMLKSQARFTGVEEAVEMLRASPAEYTVGWVDTFASPPRGIMFFGGHAEVSSAKPVREAGGRVFAAPLPEVGAISSWASRAFNQVYWMAHPNRRAASVGWREFFCPLDEIASWNKLYGSRGFSQFQCVVPMQVASEAYNEMFKLCRQAGEGSFLSVIKKFGGIESEGVLSFPREGITFAMDFPNRANTPQLVRTLSRVALASGGALYPAKMNFESMVQLESSFPAWDSWRKHWDLGGGGCQSSWIRRLGLV